jgi:hypothetical protein
MRARVMWWWAASGGIVARVLAGLVVGWHVGAAMAAIAGLWLARAARG